MPTKIDSVVQANIQAINFFYDNHYAHCQKNLESKDDTQQFDAACLMFELDRKFINETSSAKEVNRKFKQLSKRYHPDKYRQVAEPTPSKANHIFNLLKKSQAVLLRIIENPASLEPLQLEQAPYRPEYQYELVNASRRDDPNFYIDMARDINDYALKQYWGSEFLIVAEATSAPRAKVINMPGAQALYHLFMAENFYRFDRTDFQWMFKRPGESSVVPFDKGRNWLLQQALTTTKFINFMGAERLIDFAILATNAKIVTIGKNPTEVFLYYYTNFPDTISSHLLNQPGVDIATCIDFMLEHPENLYELSEYTLSGIVESSDNPYTAKLREHVLQTASLAKNLSIQYSNTYILKPFLNSKGYNTSVYEIKEGYPLVIVQLYYGNLSWLDVLSEQAINNIRSDIESSSNSFPRFILQDIDNYLSKALKYDPESFCNGYTSPIDAWQHIKATFLRGDLTILRQLNVATLGRLLDDPDSHWSNYPAIIDALIHAPDAADLINQCLATIETHLNIESSSTDSVAQRLRVVTSRKDAIDQERADKRQNKISDYLSTYRSRLMDNDASCQEISEKLIEIGASEQLDQFKQTLLPRLNNRFFDVIERMKIEGCTDSITEELHSIRQQVEYLGYSWREFTRSDRNGQAIAGTHLFSLKDKLLQLDSYAFSRLDEPTFGINLNDPDLMNALGQFKELCKLFDAEDTFVVALDEIIGKNQTNASLPFLKAKLLSFLNNELLVCIDARRRNTNSRSRHEPLEFARISPMYERLGELPKLLSLLEQVQKKLTEPKQNEVKLLQDACQEASTVQESSEKKPAPKEQLKRVKEYINLTKKLLKTQEAKNKKLKQANQGAIGTTPSQQLLGHQPMLSLPFYAADTKTESKNPSLAAHNTHIASKEGIALIRAKAEAVKTDALSTPLQKRIANYILTRNQYFLKNEKNCSALAYSALFKMRTIIPFNHGNELAKRKLRIASDALDKNTDAESIQLIKTASLEARKLTRSCRFFKEKSQGYLDAAVEEPAVKGSYDKK